MFDVTPKDDEILFNEADIIVSKTNLKGHIVYANDIFCDVAELGLSDVIGQPHSLIRHPDMPRAIFHRLWGTIQSGAEIFAYVKNMSATGRYYWVLAHVTPSRDINGNIVGYHSNRRVPNRKALDTIIPWYRELRTIENSGINKKEAMQKSIDRFSDMLREMSLSYDAAIWALENGDV